MQYLSFAGEYMRTTPKSSSSPSMTDAECDASRSAVLSAVGQTPLGRALLGQLKKASVAIVFTDRMPQVGENASVHGLYHGGHNALFINAASPLSAQLHFFAHESRHALQMQADIKLDAKAADISIHNLSPLTQVYLMRLREIDADAFAVHFLAQHDRATGSQHFDAMRQPKGLFARGDEYDRSGMYRAYADAPDAAAGVRASMRAFLSDVRLVNGYNNFAMQVWENMILPPMADYAQKPRSAYARDFAAAARRADSADQPADLFNKRAAAYSKILNRSGMPNYLSGANVSQFRLAVCDTGADTDPWKTTGHALERAMLDFNAAIRHYSRMKPAANTNKPAEKPRVQHRGHQP